MQISCDKNRALLCSVQHHFSPFGEILFGRAARLRLQIATVAAEIVFA
jgi:hypothetical protein